MARTPLAALVERAFADATEQVAEERRTTRSALREARLLGARRHRAGASPARTRRRGAAIVVVGAGLAGPDRRVPPAAGRLPRRGPRGLRPPRRPLLDAPRRLRRRPDRRARRRADRPGAHRRSASSRRSSGCSSTTCSRRSRTAPSRSTTSTARPTASRRCTRRPEGRLAEDPPRRLGRELPHHVQLSTQRGRRARQHVDRRLDQRDVPGGIDSRLGQLLDVAYNIEYGAECRAERAEPALPARLLRPGPTPHLRSVEREVPRRRRQRPDPRPARRAAARARSPRAPSSSRSAATRGHVHAHVRAEPGTKTVDGRQGRPRAPVLDPAHLGRPPKAGFERAEAIAIRELGMGTNSKLHVAVLQPPLARPRLQRRDATRTGLPEHVGGLAWRSRERAGILVDYTGGDIGASFGSGTPRVARAAVPRPDRAGPPGRDEGVERQGDIDFWPGNRWTHGLISYWKVGPVPRASPDEARAGTATATSPASTRRSTPRAT